MRSSSRFQSWSNTITPREFMHLVLRLVLMLLVFLSLNNPPPTHSIENGEGRELRVGIFPFSPFNFIDKEGIAKGINPDLLREIFRNKNVKLRFVPIDWAEGLDKLQAEEIDLMVSVAFNVERSKFMDYSQEQVLQLCGQVFVRPQSPLKSVEELFGKTVGIVSKDISGLNFRNLIETQGGSCRIIEYQTHYDVFQAIEAGEVDAGVVPEQFGMYHLKKFELKSTPILFSPFPIYFATKKGLNAEFLTQIDETLKAWKKQKNSLYYEMLDRWLFHAGVNPELPRWLIPLFAIIFVLAIVTTIFFISLNTLIRRKTQALQDSEKRFRDVVISINDWFWEVDSEGLFVLSSDQSNTLLGYSSLELKGKSIFDMTAPDQPESVRRQFTELFANHSSFRYLHQTFLHRDGREVHLSLSAIAIADKKQAFQGFRGVATDMSKLIQADLERKALEERLAQSQKMEAVGTLAGGIAHDFNNILTAILGYSELALEECPPGSEISGYIKEINLSGTRAKELVNQILAFSRRADISAVPLHPASVIKEAIRMLRASLPTTIEIRQDIENTGDCILANPAQLHQVVINLATNAFHAMEDHGGVLRIELRKVDVSMEDQAQKLNVRQGAYFRLSITDNGHGIPAHIRDKIFDPYFTTKEQGKGTGMGLAIVHGVVHDCNGYIDCISKEGEGTTFNIFLPIISEPTKATSEDYDHIPEGTERILCVDDENMIVEMLQVLLTNLGYSTMITTDSTEALKMFSARPDDFDLVITDQTMPDMTGAELAAKLLVIRPDLPIILCTGFSSQVTAERMQEIGIKALAYKPLAKRELATLIRNVLDNNSPENFVLRNGS